MTLDARKVLTRGPLLVIVSLICIFWSIPTFGVLLSSFRSEQDINETGWWTVFSLERENPAYAELTRDLEDRERAVSNAQNQLDAQQETLAAAQTDLEAARASGDAAQLSTAQTALAEAQEAVDGTQTRLERLQGRFEEVEARLASSEVPPKIRFGSSAWREQWTLDNYRAVLQTENMGRAFINSLLVTIPAVVIPITIAAFAAYAFAWMKFPLRNFFFALVVVLMVVPLHVALIPILRIYLDLDLNGTYLGIWLAHTRIRDAARHLPPVRLHFDDSKRDYRVGRSGRRVAFHLVFDPRAALVCASHCFIRYFPVLVGVERPLGCLNVSRHQNRESRGHA